jgi:pimeloyl-ACP methyl ester carboxylesterase
MKNILRRRKIGSKPILVTKMRNKKRILFATVLVILFLINGVAFFHAYSFTHFANAQIKKTPAPITLSIWQKLRILILGINNPRPTNMAQPRQVFETVLLKSAKSLECWYVPMPNSKGVVAIFHGFSGCKSMMLDRANEWWSLGYSTLLVDFPGSGGSEGNETTLGFHESKAVKTCFQYLQQKGERNIILYGGSMGAVAVLKAVSEYSISPKAIIIECPFGSLRQTTYARFHQMNLPGFPMADLLLFWGGIQQGFWAFGHNPMEYAKNVRVPTLLLYGGQDKEVSGGEITEIFENLQGIIPFRVIYCIYFIWYYS